MSIQATLFPEFERFSVSTADADGCFAPVCIAEAPEAIRALPEGKIEEKIVKAKAVLKWLMARYETSHSVSFGKDSTTTLGLAMSAAAELAREGIPVKRFLILTCDTKVENPAVAALARSERAKVKAWIARFNLPGSVHVAQPNLASEFAVSIFGGRAIPSMPGKKDCAVSWKVEPLTRLRKQLLGKNNIATGQFVCTVTGVRNVVPPTVFIN